VKHVLALFATGMAASGFATTATAGDAQPRAVIELFTSQGCSSCPPADALMNKLAEDRTLVALTFPVDYWDYLGWKDTYARPEFTARQRGYAKARGDRSVYTPQAVVNGREHVVGSDRDALQRSIENGKIRYGGLTVEVAVEAAGDVMTARVGEAKAGETSKATLWLVAYDTAHAVDIGRGENTGRSVTYSNVVRQMQAIGMWKGKAMAVELPRHDATRSPDMGVALILQTDVEGRPGPILGAALLRQPGS
jgi:hypothetical protein